MAAVIVIGDPQVLGRHARIREHQIAPQIAANDDGLRPEPAALAAVGTVDHHQLTRRPRGDRGEGAGRDGAGPGIQSGAAATVKPEKPIGPPAALAVSAGEPALSE